jgi:predicted secreted protein
MAFLAGAALSCVPTAFSQSHSAALSTDAQAAAQPPEMTLQASASAKVKQDTVNMTLAVEIQAQDQSTAGKKLSALLEDVMKGTKGVKNVDARTGAYNVWPVTNTNNKVVGWRGQGHIVLESKDFQAAAALAATVADKAAISNIDFFLSHEGREAEERKLLAQAAGAFHERALAAAKAFGFSGYRVSQLDLSGGSASEPLASNYSARTMAGLPMLGKDAKTDVTVPLQAGEVNVSVGVSGRIFLQ